jgi:hypothetical protein
MPQTPGMHSGGQRAGAPTGIAAIGQSVTIRGSQFFHVSSSSIWVGDGLSLYLSFISQIDSG